jgi:hypothetical protein
MIREERRAMKEFIEPRVEILIFETADVICGSLPTLMFELPEQ